MRMCNALHDRTTVSSALMFHGIFGFVGESSALGMLFNSSLSPVLFSDFIA